MGDGKLKVLGIASATNTIGAAVVDEDLVIAECSVSGKTAQTEKLIILVDEVLRKSSIKIKDIDAVAVTIGPGSYSGLRGGLATAKGLVKSLNIPMISVSTLHAIAYNFIDITGIVAVAINACRDDYNFALFGVGSGSLKRLTGDLTVKQGKIEEVFSSISGKIILACDERMKGKIKNENVLFAEPKNIVPWAVNVARIGLEKLRKKEVEDYISLAPTYSHKPNIREFKG